jgi:hypothetical protein
LFKIRDLKDIVNFPSDKDFTRFEFFRRSLLIIVLIIIGSFLYNLRFGHKDTSPTALITFDIIVCIIILLSTLTTRIVTALQVDLRDQKFFVYFMTALKDKNVLEVPFENLTFNFVKEPSRHQPKKWTLRVYDKKKKVFQIDTDQDGFSQKTLENLVQDLNKIKELNYDKN